MNLAKKFWNWMTNKNRVERISHLDEELIERDSLVQEQVKKLQSQDAQLSKISAKDKLKELKKNQEDLDQDVILDLLNKKNKIDSKKFEGSISFKRIFKMLSHKRYKNPNNQIDITDKDDTVVLGKFKDFVIMPNGYFAIQDANGSILSYGQTLRQVIHKPEGLSNQIKRKRIALPCNSDYEFMPDLEEYPMPECTYDEISGKIKWAKVREKPLKQLIIEREELVREKDQYIEKIEQDKVDLIRKTRDIEMALRVQSNMAENSQTELSKAMDKSIQFEQKVGELQMRTIKLQEMKNINDKLIDGLKHINSELVEKAEEMGSKTEFRKALDLVQHLISYSKQNVGQTIIKEVPTGERLPKGDEVK